MIHDENNQGSHTTMKTNTEEQNVINNNAKTKREKWNAGDPQHVIWILSHGFAPGVIERIARVHMEFSEEEIRHCKEEALTGRGESLSYYILNMWIQNKWIHKLYQSKSHSVNHCTLPNKSLNEYRGSTSNGMHWKT